MTTNSEATSKISDDHRRSVEINSIGDRETLYTLLRRFVSGVTSPDAAASPPPPLFRRIRTSFLETAPKLPDASRNSAHDLLIWTRRGSPLRSLLVISVGTIVLVALTGLLIFTLFLLAATLNAVIISFLISLAAAGGFLALFFACLTAVYIWSLSVAIFVISITTSLTIFAVVIATGWVGFFWVVWLTANKSLNIAKSSLSMTTSALAAYSASRHSHHSTSLKSAN
ncbi:uncharacterized protein LOC120282681 [Dioscorea cayenensis subsp. rotundata]|uniref:Uncharacterized protein LOC120282681 n=1 Tax=Dioscorea cayennensis subsp. rotundata TaxID=55577 RepID=A0AB40D5A8_DIOCR|nr:uncharacterized protein LOC120282681 [Dioscorea cayenensis subsp. rotundata]